MASDVAGRVVVLNGSSSAGKTTLAIRLQEILAEAGSCWVIFSWDDFMPRVPARWHAIPGFVGDLSDDGCHYVVVDDGDEFSALLEMGELGTRVLSAYHEAIGAMARAGLNVIVEEVMITGDEWDDWQRALDGVDVRWVGVRCDVEVVVERERQRGDRHKGLARGTSQVVHQQALYDVEVDTSANEFDDVVSALFDQLEPWLTG